MVLSAFALSIALSLERVKVIIILRCSCFDRGRQTGRGGVGPGLVTGFSGVVVPVDDCAQLSVQGNGEAAARRSGARSCLGRCRRCRDEHLECPAACRRDGRSGCPVSRQHRSGDRRERRQLLSWTTHTISAMDRCASAANWIPFPFRPFRIGPLSLDPVPLAHSFQPFLPLLFLPFPNGQGDWGSAGPFPAIGM